MTQQPGFTFDDPDSRTRSKGLDVVYARMEKSGQFDLNLFGGFSSLHALTYTPSIPMIFNLLKSFDYDDFECIFGHSGILPREAANILAFQSVVDEKLNAGFVAVKGLPEERRKVIYDRAVDGAARFYVVKDAIAHAKIYLLEREGLRRVIVGSANLSETAFSGRQAETLIAFDNDEVAWEHYSRQYQAVRDIAVNRLALREKPIPAEIMPLEETPAIREAETSESGIAIYVPAEQDDEVEYSIPRVLATIEHISPSRKQALAGERPDRTGNLRLVPRVVREMIRISRARQDDDAPKTYLSYDGRAFNLSGGELSLNANLDDAKSDVAAWLEFFGNYENGFVGDVPRLQRDYFTFMCWFYFSPLMCDLRNTALRQNRFSFDQPMFAVLYGESNCGKSSLIETLMTSMFSHPRIVETRFFTPGNLRGLQENYKRFPVVFDDVTRDRFNRHAPEIIKDETISYSEYPCFALSMNAETRAFPDEIIKRCLMIYTRTSLPGNDPASRRRLQRSVAEIRGRMTTSLYSEYLRRVHSELDSIPISELENLDALEFSSSTLCQLFQENLPDGVRLPDWCIPMTLDEYQRRAFERPRRILESLIHQDKYTSGRVPPAGSWTISGEMVIVGVEQMAHRRTREDIPDWILEDTASVAGQISMKRDLLEEFLNRRVRRPRKFLGLL